MDSLETSRLAKLPEFSLEDMLGFWWRARGGSDEETLYTLTVSLALENKHLQESLDSLSERVSGLEIQSEKT